MTQGLPLWVTILSSVGLPTIIASGFLVVSKALELRSERRKSEAGMSAAEEVEERAWNATYRASAEAHMAWDFALMGRLQRVEHRLGIDEPIPQPPPLFPRQ